MRLGKLTLQVAIVGCISLCLTTPTQAGVVNKAIDHPYITGAAILGTAIAIKAATRCSAAERAALPAEATADCDAASAAPKVSLKDKAALLLLKSQTKELRKNLAANGENDKKGCAAHHIVPRKEGRSWAKKDADLARGVLGSCGINIDAAINGVYLPYNDDAECDGANHRNLHNGDYYAAVASFLLRAQRRGCGEVEKQLGEIKNMLRQSTFPGGH